MNRSFLIFFSVLSLSIFEVEGFSEKLSGESIVYGLAFLAGNNQSFGENECLENLKVFYESVEERQVWALKVLDASGQPETGFLYGNNLWIGSHGHCMDVSNQKPLEINHDVVKHPPPTPFDYPPYSLKFVKVLIGHNNTLQLHTNLPLDFTIRIGLCIPKNCSNEDIFQLFEDYLPRNYLNAQQMFNLSLQIKQVKTLEEDFLFMFPKPKFILLCSILAVIFILAVVGTILDFKKHKANKKFLKEFKQQMMGTGTMRDKANGSEIELVKTSQESINREQSTLIEVLRCFSVYSNTKAMMSTTSNADNISCIHGIRFLGMLWICVIHAVYYAADYVRDPAFAFRISEDFISQIITNSTFSVDTYLLISGFLLSYLFYKSRKASDGSVNIAAKLQEFGMMCFHRVLRLSPVYLFVILLTDVIYTYLREVSPLESSETPDLVCSQYWWRNILYINNFFPRTEMCLSWSWYLSVDTQAFLVSVILLLVSTFALKFAVFTLVFLILGCVVSTANKSYSIGYIPTMDEQLAHLDEIYDLPWNRFGPYLVGVATGYLLVVKLQHELNLGKVTKILLWILFPLLNVWILFTLYTRQISVEFSAVYLGVSRTLWGIGIAWLILACCTGNGEIVNKFLSFPGWKPFSRLTFCAYLLNPLMANALYVLSESTKNSTRFAFAISMMGNTFGTFLASFALSVLFEFPFILLTKILIRKISPRKEKQKNTKSENKS